MIALALLLLAAGTPRFDLVLSGGRVIDGTGAPWIRADLGIRGDLYNGLSVSRQVQPRVGISYNVPKTATVARISYARTMETPFNENLVLSSKGCNDAVIAALVPCIPANFNAGFRNLQF